MCCFMPLLALLPRTASCVDSVFRNSLNRLLRAAARLPVMPNVIQPLRMV